jgi:hypothetical protein
MGMLIIMLIVVPIGLFLAVPEAEYLIPIGRQFPNGVSGRFLSAMIDHQGRALKAITAPELWPRIDEWLETHQEVDCAGPLWWEPLDIPPITREVLVDEPTFRQESVVLARECSNEPITYCAKLVQISLRLTGEGWIVEDWRDIEESQVGLYSGCPYQFDQFEFEP